MSIGFKRALSFCLAVMLLVLTLSVSSFAATAPVDPDETYPNIGAGATHNYKTGETGEIKTKVSYDVTTTGGVTVIGSGNNHGTTPTTISVKPGDSLDITYTLSFINGYGDNKDGTDPLLDLYFIAETETGATLAASIANPTTIDDIDKVVLGSSNTITVKGTYVVPAKKGSINLEYTVFDYGKFDGIWKSTKSANGFIPLFVDMNKLTVSFDQDASIPGDKNAWKVQNTNPFDVTFDTFIGNVKTGTRTISAGSISTPATLEYVEEGNGTVTNGGTLKITWKDAENKDADASATATAFRSLLVEYNKYQGTVMNGTSVLTNGAISHFWIGTPVSLSATANAGYAFNHWIDLTTQSAITPLAFNMDEHSMVHADFDTILTIQKYIGATGTDPGAGFRFKITCDPFLFPNTDARMSPDNATMLRIPYLPIPSPIITDPTDVNGIVTVKLPESGPSRYILEEYNLTGYTNDLPENGLSFQVNGGHIIQMKEFKPGTGILQADRAITIGDDVKDDMKPDNKLTRNTIEVRNTAIPVTIVSSTTTTSSTPASNVALNLTVAGPGKVNPGSGAFAQNSYVAFVVTPDSGAKFVGWSGPDGADVTADNMLQMLQSRTLTATFAYPETTVAPAVIPQSAPEVTPTPVPDSGAVVIVTPVVVPQAAPALPKTGGLPVGLLMAIGTALSGSGLLLRRKKNGK